MSESLVEDSPGRASKIAAGMILTVIFLTPLIGFVWLGTVSQATANEHLLWHARDMTIRHYARTRGRWPASWKDLEEDFEPADAQYGTDDLATMKRRVRIDFEFDPQTVATASVDDPPCIVWFIDDRDSDMVRESNAKLVQFLKDRQSNSEG